VYKDKHSHAKIVKWSHYANTMAKIPQQMTISMFF